MHNQNLVLQQHETIPIKISNFKIPIQNSGPIISPTIILTEASIDITDFVLLIIFTLDVKGY